ncbi:MAG: peptidoglycan DD-metalloendopeptidase family protein [Bacteroidales bacterium]
MKNKKLYIIIGSLIVITTAILLIFFLSENKTFQSEEIVEYDHVFPEYDIYGIEKDNYFTIEGRVQRNQTFSQILSQYDIDYSVINDVIKKTGAWFDLRRVRANNNYIAYLECDTINIPRYFIYDISKLEYIKVCFYDSVEVVREIKEVKSIPKEASGVINSSLWLTLTENELHPELAIKMSEILAWSVDFHRLFAGDKFKVIYEEQFVGDESIGVGSIDAIYFQHHGSDVYGFSFESDTIKGFFDPEGENLRKVFLKSPLKFGRITSRYSHSRFHPIHKVRRPHYGTDYAAPQGTPILAVGDGVVTEARYKGGNGNYVKIRHNSVYETQYLHMSRFAKGAKPGKRVEQGDVIGYVGMTGYATGPHVCFRFWKNGKQVDHLREEFPSADPLPEEYFNEFSVLRDSLMKKLNKISFEDPMIVQSED